MTLVLGDTSGLAQGMGMFGSALNNALTQAWQMRQQQAMLEQQTNAAKEQMLAKELMEQQKAQAKGNVLSGVLSAFGEEGPSDSIGSNEIFQAASQLSEQGFSPSEVNSFINTMLKSSRQMSVGNAIASMQVTPQDELGLSSKSPAGEGGEQVIYENGEEIETSVRKPTSSAAPKEEPKRNLAWSSTLNTSIDLDKVHENLNSPFKEVREEAWKVSDILSNERREKAKNETAFYREERKLINDSLKEARKDLPTLQKNQRAAKRLLEIVNNGNLQPNLFKAIILDGLGMKSSLGSFVLTDEQKEARALINNMLNVKRTGGSNPSTVEVLLDFERLPGLNLGDEANRAILNRYIEAGDEDIARIKNMGDVLKENRQISYVDWISDVDSRSERGKSMNFDSLQNEKSRAESGPQNLSEFASMLQRGQITLKEGHTPMVGPDGVPVQVFDEDVDEAIQQGYKRI